jgi:hypothetical protein
MGGKNIMKQEAKKCCVCGGRFSCNFAGKPYCNKHWQRMYYHGTHEKIGRSRTNTYELCGNVLRVYTKKGETILVDAEDAEKAKKFSWCISKTGYVVANIGGKVIKLHRFLLGIEEQKEIVDHINGNPLDNRRINLRICTCAENNRNCKLSKNNSTGHTGVSHIKSTGKFRARIMLDRKEIQLGRFDTYEEAVKAREQAEIKYFGEFAPKARSEV